MNQMRNEQFEEKTREVAGDLTVKKNRVFDNIAKAVTLILAIAIGLYVVSTNVVEKPVPLTVKEKNGLNFSDYVTLECQSLVVRGASALVDPLQLLQLEDFSAKNLVDQDGDGLVEIELGIKEAPTLVLMSQDSVKKIANPSNIKAYCEQVAIKA